MSETQRDELPEACRRVSERLLDVVEGELDASTAEHLAECDYCRDLGFEVEKAAQVAARAGSDFQLPAEFEASFMQRIDGQESSVKVGDREGEPAKAGTGGSGTSGSRMAVPESGIDALLRFLRGRRGPAALTAFAAVVMVLALWVRERSSDRRQDAGDLFTTFQPDSVRLDSASPWGGTVEQVVKGFGSREGLQICDDGGRDCSAASRGLSVAPGAVLKTDGLTRARLSLNDGTELLLDRATELQLDEDAPRRARLVRGDIILDVRRQLRELAVVTVPDGRVEVVGTKFALRANERGTEVDVSRGQVRLVDEEGRDVRVNAGQRGSLAPRGRGEGASPRVVALASLADGFTWSERTFAHHDELDTGPRGLGELRAKKPGEEHERKGAIRLTRHAVKVRVQETLARTEVEEVFTNDTDEVLEGIFRFPLPADAEIERLALEVDGRLEEGAFVDRERAAAIWRGAIVNSSKKPPPVREEIVWVPGPWKDPALLEWQAGGRFELRIFPIPKRGQRRVILAYTQKLKPQGDRVSYTYPLAHDESGSTRVADFSIDVRVAGHEGPLSTSGYDFERHGAQGDETARLELSERDFVPSGDITLSYRLQEPGREVRAWAYSPRVNDRDESPYVAMAFRPQLPLQSNDVDRSYVFVVDRSRSMYGEQYRRAVNVVERAISELDREASVAVLVCDSECSSFDSTFRAPSPKLAEDVSRFLGKQQPEGASDLVAALKTAAKWREESDGGELHIVYVGDGTPTVGEVESSFLQEAIRRDLPRDVSVFAVTVGADSDLRALQAVTRAGGGVLLPYAPGRSVGETVLALLGASYGRILRDVQVHLPEGLTETAPSRLGSVAAGEEFVVVARMNDTRIAGQAVVQGFVGQERFEQSYDVELAASEGEGNAFVPRLFAAQWIHELESRTNQEARERAVELSGRFNVASRHTSLLVLESPAMFKAFGLNNERSVPLWTGEDEAVSTVAGDETELFRDESKSKDLAAEFESPLDDRQSFGSGSSGFAPAPKSARRRAPGRASKPRAAARPEPESSCGCSPRDPLCSCFDKKEDDSWPGAEQAIPPPPRAMPARRPMVPMRRVWDRVASISVPPIGLRGAARRRIDELEARLEDNPLSRDAFKDLYEAVFRAGEMNRAAELAERWSEKDPLDPAALTARADIAAQRGDRALALRILGSVVDVRPNDHKPQWRLARAFRWAGERERGCRYSLAVAQRRNGDAELLAEAMRCLRGTGQDEVATALLGHADEAVRRDAEGRLARYASNEDELLGDFEARAAWEGERVDLDLVIVHPDGYRVSWLGAPTRSLISARDVVSRHREGLSLRGAKPGEYAIELVRSSADELSRVTGHVEIEVSGTRRSVPFVLDGIRTRIATVDLKMKSRLVPF